MFSEWAFRVWVDQDGGPAGYARAFHHSEAAANASAKAFIKRGANRAEVHSGRHVGIAEFSMSAVLKTYSKEA